MIMLSIDDIRRVLNRPRIDEFEPSVRYVVLEDDQRNILSIERMKYLSRVRPFFDLIPGPVGKCILKLEPKSPTQSNERQ